MNKPLPDSVYRRGGRGGRGPVLGRARVSGRRACRKRAFTVVGSRASAPLFADTAGAGAPDRAGTRRASGLARPVEPGARDRLGPGRRPCAAASISGRLRRQKRAVRVAPEPTEDPVHAVVEAARVLQLEDETPAPRLFFGEETQAAADALIGRRTARSWPSGRARTGSARPGRRNASPRWRPPCWATAAPWPADAADRRRRG